MLRNYSNPDLHSHSVFSDGTLTPAELARRARSHTVDLWSLTDHDGVTGQAQAIEAARHYGLDYLTGVEISVSYARKTVHIVALGFDHENQAFIQGLEKNRVGRDARALEMAHALERAGIPGSYDGALKYAGHPEAISRTHFARFLVDSGVCRNTGEVFQRYLIEGKPGFVPHRWAALETVMAWITAAGGVAIIAHPGRYGFDAAQENAFFLDFQKLGGCGIEVATGSHSRNEIRRYADAARQYGFAASRGSDFHSPGEGRSDLGKLPGLPADLPAVWSLLAGKIKKTTAH